MNNDRKVAYFTMEIALDPGMPTYSGGLGVLAGDTIRSGADLKVPMVGVTLLHRKGYFYQRLAADGTQTEEPVTWRLDDFLERTHVTVAVTIEGRTVNVTAWRRIVTGVSGYTVPVYFLDTDLPENAPWDRTLTDFLYGGDSYYRLCQEVVLGVGGMKMLRALGHAHIQRYHMNEGHAALLALELLREEAGQDICAITEAIVDRVKEKCVFTTHTPVAAGMDQFPAEMADRVLGPACESVRGLAYLDGRLNMTYLALNLSHFVNGVAKRHGEVSRLMFARYSIDSITNGVHAATWTAEPFQDLFDRYVPGWREDNFSLRYALSIPKQDIWAAHIECKNRLITLVNHETNAGMNTETLTLGFARRSATYKRGDLLVADIERLKAIVEREGPLQIVYAGKAHPQDEAGKELIRRIVAAAGALKGKVKVAYLSNYSLILGRLFTSGADGWVNTPQPPMEASGTSGMKAALNGVPSLSILDGWWVEGCIEGSTGWAIGEKHTAEQQETERDRPADADAMYDKLENFVLPTFYQDRDRWLDMMLHSIALNGSFFNTQRMVSQYVLKAYFL